jgi:hypothetical protein
LPTTTLLMRTGCPAAYCGCGEHRVADRDQRFLDLEPVAPLHFVARERAQRFAHEVRVGHLDDRIGIVLARLLDRRAEALHEHGIACRRFARRCARERDLQVVAAEHRIVAGEVFV